MVNYRISLVVTSFNSAAFIKKAFEMLLAAESFLYEVIFVDDCSNDDTNQLIENFISKNEKNIKYIHRILKKNSGRPSEPRNIGKKLASGDWIVFCDIDDLIPIDYFKHLTYQKPDKVLSLTKLPIKDQSALPLEISLDFGSYKLITDSQLRYKNMISLSGAAIPSKFVNLESFPSGVLEDWKYWQALSSHDIKFVKYTRVPVFYWAPTTLSPKKNKQFLRVLKWIGFYKIPLYIFYTLLLRRWEKRLEVYIQSNQSIPS